MINNKTNIYNEWSKMLINGKKNIKQNEQLLQTDIIWNEILNKEEKINETNLQKLELKTMKIQDQNVNVESKFLIISIDNEDKKIDEYENSSFFKLLSNNLPNFITKYFI